MTSHPRGPGQSFDLGELDRSDGMPPLEWWLREVDPYSQMPPDRRFAEAERMRLEWHRQLLKVAAGRGSRRLGRPRAVPPRAVAPVSSAWSEAAYEADPIDLTPLDATRTEVAYDAGPIDLTPLGAAPPDVAFEVVEVVETRTVRVTRAVVRPLR